MFDGDGPLVAPRYAALATLIPASAPAVAAPLPFAAIAVGAASVAVALTAATPANLAVGALPIPGAAAALAIAANLAGGAVSADVTARAHPLVDAAPIATKLVLPVAVAVAVARRPAIGNEDADTVPIAGAAALQAGVALRAADTGLSARRPLGGDLGGGAPGEADARQTGGKALQGVAPVALVAESAGERIEPFAIHDGTCSFSSGYGLWPNSHMKWKRDAGMEATSGPYLSRSLHASSCSYEPGTRSVSRRYVSAVSPRPGEQFSAPTISWRANASPRGSMSRSIGSVMRECATDSPLHDALEPCIPVVGNEPPCERR